VVGLLWTSDQPVAKVCVYTGQHNTETQRQTSMPRVRLEPMIPVTKRPRPTTEIMLPPEPASLNLLPCNFGHYDIYTVWHDIAFHNFENMLYDHKQVKMQIHIGLEVSIFWGTSTSTLYVACAEGLPVKNFLVMIVLGCYDFRCLEVIQLWGKKETHMIWVDLYLSLGVESGSI
jgi:hypothetical protein